MMTRLAARIAWSIAVVWAVVTLTFFVNEVLPSNPARMVSGPQATAVEVAQVRLQLGLDRPVATRYAMFIARLVHFGPREPIPRDPLHATCGVFGPLHVDLGRSYVHRRAVVTILGERLPRSAALAAVAVVVEMAIGITLGLFAAARRRTAWDTATVGATLLAASIPTFLTGLALQYVFAYRLRWLPFDGYGKTTADQARAIVLPALTLGTFGAAFATRLVRSEVSAALAGDHARTARAKGASRLQVLVRHGLRNALAPVITVAGLDFGALVGGAVVVETLFRWPGMGMVGVAAILDRDGPLVMGTVLVSSITVVVANLTVDLVQAWLDPRVRA